MEDARIDEDRTKRAALEKLIGRLKKDVVRVDHYNTIVFHQAPSVKFVHCQFEPCIEVTLIFIWILQIFNCHHLQTVLEFPVKITSDVKDRNQDLRSK